MNTAPPPDLDFDSETAENKEKQFVVRLDAEHYEALVRISKAERMKKQEAMKHLIRFADQLVSGPASPFTGNFISLFQRQRKAG